MFCRKCGYQNEDGSKFCMNCGTNLSEAVSEEKPKEEEKTVQAVQPIEEKTNEQPDVQSQPDVQGEPQLQAQPGYHTQQYYQQDPQMDQQQGYQQPYQQSYQMNGNMQGGYVYYQYAPIPGRGLAIASMVLGIISLVLCVYLIPAVLAIIFGAVAKSKGYRRGMSTAGIVCGIISLAVFVLYIIFAVVIGISFAGSEVFYY